MSTTLTQCDMMLLDDLLELQDSTMQYSVLMDVLERLDVPTQHVVLSALRLALRSAGAPMSEDFYAEQP